MPSTRSHDTGAPSFQDTNGAAPPGKIVPAAVGAGAATLPRNVLSVVLGDTLFKTWYSSFYPEELVGKHTDRLHVCSWCFRYVIKVEEYVAHRELCELKDAPLGRMIYQKGDYEIYEVDGAKKKIFAQNLSLFAKLFLDTKSVFFDVFGFKYYLLIQKQPDGHSQPVGFFSKEKMSWDNNNLACILVFPPWQKQGLGQILMGASYELSERDGKIGGPEKPLSELGRKSYLRFWQARLSHAILGLRNKSSIEVKELARLCAMTTEDVIMTLKSMGVCETRKKDDGLGVSKSRVREWVETAGIDLTPPVDPAGFVPVDDSSAAEEDEDEMESDSGL